VQHEFILEGAAIKERCKEVLPHLQEVIFLQYGILVRERDDILSQKNSNKCLKKAKILLTSDLLETK
jgi:hypothetical protein